jgi:hypothetical protein
VRSTAPSASPLELHCAAVTFCWRMRLIAVSIPRFVDARSGGRFFAV